MKFRKKPVEIDAVHYTDNPDEVEAFLGASFIRWGEQNTIRVETLEGPLTASPGDWIIRGVQGELYPCKPDIFAETYEEVS